MPGPATCICKTSDTRFPSQYPRSSMTVRSPRALTLLAALTTLALARTGHAQEDDDVREIRHVIGVYFRGHATANPDTMRAAFLPTAHIEGIRNGAFTSWTVDQYVAGFRGTRSEEHTSELQSRQYLVCRLLLEKKKNSLRPTHW